MISGIIPRFPSNPLMIRVPLFLLFSFDKETPKSKGQKGTAGVPRSLIKAYWTLPVSLKAS